MKTLTFILLALLVTACAGAGAPGTNVDGGNGLTNAIKYIHDDENSVGCWYIVGTSGAGSISCLPDEAYR